MSLWKVEISNTGSLGIVTSVQGQAETAAEAGAKALVLAKFNMTKNEQEQLFVSSVRYLGEVEF